MSKNALTPRSIIYGLLGMILITASSMFMALKIGTMPWPILFATILSMTLVGQGERSSLQEVSLTETIMSSGAMVAGGLVFTIPGIWMLDPDATINFFPILCMMVSGVLLGITFSYLYRNRLIVEQDLVFPIGNAAYETISTGIKKGKDSVRLVGSIGFSAVFALLRDILHVFPTRLTLYAGGSLVQPISLWLSPMALSIGAMINTLSAMLWLGGTIFAFFIFTPLSLKLGFFESMLSADEWRKNIGIGIVIGTGIGVFVKAILDHFFQKKEKGKKASSLSLDKKEGVLCLAAVVLSILLLTFGTPLRIQEAILAAAGAGLTVLLSGMLTGQCGTNPLEVFGILVMIASSVLFKGGKESLFLTAAVVSTACGLTGVMMNDFKSGYKLKTDVKAQVKAELIGALMGALLATAMIFVIKRSVGTFGTDEYPSPQAAAVASLIKGSSNNTSLLYGIAIGFVLYLCKVPSATLGLGFYLPIHISLSMGIGAFVSMALKKSGKMGKKDINLVSSGFMGGEGIIGVLVAISSIFR